jgi:uncharacterized membrane protein
LGSGSVFLALAIFLAAAVEAVEAVTIVLAVGTTRGWRSTFYGVAAATVILGLLVAILGPALRSIPIDALRAVVGTLLLLFGLQWLRKAVLRASGLMAQRDESTAYAKERDAAASQALPAAGAIDWTSFTLAFKGVLLEGLEVVFIVVTVGAAQHQLGLAAASGAIAVIVVIAVGIAVRGPLARVPENTLKFGVGVLLTTFGVFWTNEGLGIHWPGGDTALFAILAFVLIGSLAIVRAQRARLAARTRLHPVPVGER